MMRVVKRREMRERGPMKGRNLVWKKCCALKRKKPPRVTKAIARGIPK